MSAKWQTRLMQPLYQSVIEQHGAPKPELDRTMSWNIVDLPRHLEQNRELVCN